MRRRKARKQNHLFEATAIAGGVMILVLIGLGIKSTGPEFTAAVVQGDIIAFTNIERAHSELHSLTENTILDRAAQAKANDMASLGYFSHTGPDGQPPWHWFVEAGYDYHYAGENLAVRFNDSQEVVNAWMASPTHKANIVKAQYTEIGIGVADGVYQGQPVTFVVQFFGAPKTASVAKLTRPTQTAAAQQKAGSVYVRPTAPTVAGAETAKVSLFARITSFFSVALHSLTASATEADGVIIGGGVSTER